MEELFTKALELLSSVEGSALTIAIVVEFVFRMVPSEKPRSILLLVAKACELSGKFLVKLSEVLNKLIPQKLK